MAPFDLSRAATLAPKAPGGLNIEGLTATPDGRLLIGFRNPVPNNRALVIPLENPEEVLAGGTARFGPPQLLDLGGLGIRSLSWWRSRYLVAAGPVDDGIEPRLYTWDGTSPPGIVEDVGFPAFNPEGFFSPEERDEILLLSDDGEVLVDGVACKDLRDPARKRFRGAWLRLPN